jgi:hypothetical protein
VSPRGAAGVFSFTGSPEPKAIDRGSDAIEQRSDPKRGDGAGKNVHRVVSAKHDDRRCFENDDEKSERGQPRLARTHELCCAEYGDRRVPGKEEIAGHGVGDQKRREAGIVPDHVGRRGKGAQRLKNLA